MDGIDSRLCVTHNRCEFEECVACEAYTRGYHEAQNHFDKSPWVWVEDELPPNCGPVSVEDELPPNCEPVWVIHGKCVEWRRADDQWFFRDNGVWVRTLYPPRKWAAIPSPEDD